MNERLNQTVEQIEDRIRNVMARILTQDFRRFRCTRAILYHLDRLTGFLEPVFLIPDVAYRELEPIPSSPGDGEFIANRAFADGQIVFSLDPSKDERWCPESRATMEAYGINGAIIASPLVMEASIVNESIEQASVLVLCADQKLDLPNPNQEIHDVLGDVRLYLAYLLALREIELAADTAEKYELLTRAILSQLRPIATPDTIRSTFVQRCNELLRSTAVALDVRNSRSGEPTQDRYSTSNFADLGALDKVRDELSNTSRDVLGLNRPRQSPQLFDSLTLVSPEHRHVWAAVRVRDEPLDTVCIVGRTADILADHWTEHDLTFLRRSIHLLHVVLKRSTEFNTLLKQLRSGPVQGGKDRSPFSRSRFDLICHICREYLNVDQLLLTQVTRDALSYKITGVHAEGFGENNKWIKEHTQRYLQESDVHSTQKIDVMPHILRDYLRVRESSDDQAKLPRLYSCKINDGDGGFIINDTVVGQCNLSGVVAFLPCYSRGNDGTPVLQSILHLGNSAGDLNLPDEFIPLLSSLAESIAEAMENDERTRREELLGRIRHLDEPREETLREGLLIIKEVCHSADATIFLRLPAVRLVRWPQLKMRDVEAAFQRLLSMSQADSQAEFECVNSMLRACLGLSCDAFSQLLNAAFQHADVAPILAEATYVRVASTDNSIAPEEDYLRMKAAVRSTNDDDFRRGFTEFLSKSCYLAGYGLTGWVARYRRSVLLADKNPKAVRAFYERIRSTLDKPSVDHIVRQMRDSHITCIFEDGPIVPPEHVDHIQDRFGMSGKRDTFVACPMENIEDPRYSVGVIRTSTSAALRTSFDRQDEMAVEEIAQHFSWMLHREFTKQEDFFSAHTGMKQLVNQIVHHRSRIAEAVFAVRTYVESSAGNKENVSNALHDLDGLRRRIEQYGRQDNMIRGIAATSPETINVGKVATIINEMMSLSTHVKPVNVDLACRAEEPVPGNHHVRDLLLGLCLITDELASNSFRYSKGAPDALRVVVGLSEGLEIQIVECDHATNMPITQLHRRNGKEKPYTEVLQEGKQHQSRMRLPQGGRLIREFTNRLGLEVTMWPIDSRFIYSIRSKP